MCKDGCKGDVSGTGLAMPKNGGMDQVKTEGQPRTVMGKNGGEGFHHWNLTPMPPPLPGNKASLGNYEGTVVVNNPLFPGGGGGNEGVPLDSHDFILAWNWLNTHLHRFTIKVMEIPKMYFRGCAPQGSPFLSVSFF